MIAFNAATLRLGGKTIVENLDLDVRQFLFIVGASGCGKTTALRLAACLYRPAQPRREVAIMFPGFMARRYWRTACGNISLAGGLPARERPGRIVELRHPRHFARSFDGVRDRQLRRASHPIGRDGSTRRKWTRQYCQEGSLASPKEQKIPTYIYIYLWPNNCSHSAQGKE